MREILFRGKRTDGKGFVYGDYIHCGISGKDFIFPKNNEVNESQLVGEEGCLKLFTLEVIPETVGQYTGLTDKNGKKIFEGDIVRYQFDNDDCPFPNKNTEKRIGRVFFLEFRASFSVTAGRNGSVSMNNDLFKYVQNGNRVEVIGNIYDNPELLEVEE